MLDSLLSIIAPDYCICCQKLGTVICERCKKGIAKAGLAKCVLCGHRLQAGACQTDACQLRGTRQLVVCYGDATMKKLIHEYKYTPKQSVAAVLAELTKARLSLSPSPDYCLTPLPPSPKHCRQRGFDHTSLLVRHLAKAYALPYRHTLLRRGNQRQVGAGRSQRFRQQAGAYRVRSGVNLDAHYVLVDDVITTGASMAAGVSALRGAGVRQITILALLASPLDDTGDAMEPGLALGN